MTGAANAGTATSASAVNSSGAYYAVHYVDVNWHLHQAYTSNSGTSWSDWDVTGGLIAAGKSVPVVAPGSSIACAFNTVGNYFAVHYEGTDLHLHEAYISGGVWVDWDITASISGAPNLAPAAAIANAVDTGAGYFTVHYEGADSHLHEAFVSGGSWHDWDITANTAGAVALAAGSAIANAFNSVGNYFAVHYEGTDLHLHEAYISGGAWHDWDVTAHTSGAPNLASAASPLPTR